MDPVNINLSSVAGIVALTITFVQAIKGRLGQLPLLKELPLAVYVVCVSGALTWFAHDVLHVLEGARVELITQAVLQAFVASGVVEWWRAGAKPVEETAAAEKVSLHRHYLIPILLAVGLSAGCASTGRVLVETERGIHATLAGADDAINLACDRGLRSADDCKGFNASIAAAWSSYENYNRAAQEGSIAGVPAMVGALGDLRLAVSSASPQASALLADLKRLYDTLTALLPKEKTR